MAARRPKPAVPNRSDQLLQEAQRFYSKAWRLGGLNPVCGMGQIDTHVHGSALLHASLCLLCGAPFQLSPIPVPFVINDAGDDGAEGVSDPVGQLDGASSSEGLPEFIESAVE